MLWILSVPGEKLPIATPTAATSPILTLHVGFNSGTQSNWEEGITGRRNNEIEHSSITDSQCHSCSLLEAQCGILTDQYHCVFLTPSNLFVNILEEPSNSSLSEKL